MLKIKERLQELGILKRKCPYCKGKGKIKTSIIIRPSGIVTIDTVYDCSTRWIVKECPCCLGRKKL